MNGPPGAGKTTLVASYLTSRNLPCLWYQVDPGDDDAATFFHYFSQAARKHLPAEDASLRDFDPAIASDLTSFSRRYFREFYARLKTPLVVVLDNYQELADRSPSHDLVRIACEETPENCHIVIVSREACPRPLGRIRFSQALTIIGADELALTLEETRGIAESRGIKLQSTGATLALQTQSAGWMMGLMLLMERNGSNDNRGTDLSLAVRHGQGEPAFDYFAGEVFGNLDAESRDLLLQSALFPMMTVHRVTQLTGTPRAGELLLDFLRANRFVIRHGGNESAYQFHPLFREFLLNQRARRFVDAELASQYCKAAEVLISDGDDEGALALLEQARNWRRMADVILATAAGAESAGPPRNSRHLDRQAARRSDRHEPLAALLARQQQGVFRSRGQPGDPGKGLPAVQRGQRLPGHGIELVRCSWMASLTSTGTLRHMDPWIVEFNERLESRLDAAAAGLLCPSDPRLLHRALVSPAFASRNVAVAGTGAQDARDRNSCGGTPAVTPAPRHTPHPARRACGGRIHSEHASLRRQASGGRTAPSHAGGPHQRSHGRHACRHGRARAFALSGKGCARRREPAIACSIRYFSSLAR